MAEPSTNRKKYIPFSGLSIQQRLPLLICVLLLSVVLAFGWLSEIGVRKAAMEMGKERLGELTRQLGSLFGAICTCFGNGYPYGGRRPGDKKLPERYSPQ